MKKQIVCAGILVFSLAGCQLLPGFGGENQTQESNGGSQENGASDGSMFSGTFFDLLARGQAAVCEWEMASEQGNVSGKTYVSGERLRSEATVESPRDGAPITVNSIIDGGFVYSWTSDSDTGMKMTVPKDSNEGAVMEEEEQLEQMPQDLSEEVQFDCQPWSVDATMFDPPASVEFQDLSTMMGQLEGLGETSADPEATPPVDVCGFCETLPEGQPRETCLANC